MYVHKYVCINIYTVFQEPLRAAMPYRLHLLYHSYNYHTSLRPLTHYLISPLPIPQYIIHCDCSYMYIDKNQQQAFLSKQLTQFSNLHFDKVGNQATR